MSPHAPTNAGDGGPIAGNRDRVAALAANVSALRARFGAMMEYRRLPASLTVTLPASRWPTAIGGTVRGVACRLCGADDWRRRAKNRGHDCRSCERRQTEAKKARRRARAALGAIDGRTA